MGDTRYDSLQRRLVALQRELSELDEKLGDTQALVRRKKELQAALAGLSKRTPHRVALPMLRRLSVAAPCDEKWEEMKGDESARFCGSCAQTVFNLSAMTEVGIQGLLAEHGSDLCVRFYQRKDGTVMSQDCLRSAGRRRRRRLIAAALGVSAVALVAVAMSADAPYVPCPKSSTGFKVPLKVIEFDLDTDVREPKSDHDVVEGKLFVASRSR